MYTEEQKQQIYKRWIERGRPWFNIDSSKDATPEERDIVLEMNKRENEKAKRNIQLDKRAADIRERYGKHGKLSDSIFDY